LCLLFRVIHRDRYLLVNPISLVHKGWSGITVLERFDRDTLVYRGELI